jgi:hypothetical protein
MKTVLVETWNPPGLCRGHAEIRYARTDCGWIEVHKALGEYGDLRSAMAISLVGSGDFLGGRYYPI